MGGIAEEGKKLEKTCYKCKCKETGKKTIKGKCPSFVDCGYKDGEYHKANEFKEED